MRLTLECARCRQIHEAIPVYELDRRQVGPGVQFDRYYLCPKAPYPLVLLPVEPMEESAA
jgi:hypothetical protein